MPYEITQIDPAIVAVIHTGDASAREAAAARADVAEMMAAHGIRLLLADIRRAHISAELFNLYEFNASHYDVLPVGTKIATVASPDSLDETLMAFSETVALNRGILFRLFFDYDESLTWLRA